MKPRASRLNKNSGSSAETFETAKQLLELVENLRGPVASQAGSEEKIPDGWAQQVVDALLNRLVRRIPRAASHVEGDASADTQAEHCPFSGLNRGQLYELIKSGSVKTVSLKKANEVHGARFYYVGSALSALDHLAAEQALAAENKKNHGKLT